MTEKERKEQLDKKYEELKKNAEQQLAEQDDTYDDGVKVFLSKDECIEQGIECHNEKKYLAKEMVSVAKACSEQTGVDKKAILKTKDYLHYKGNGWGEDCLDRSEEKVKYPDRVSPAFRRVFEIIDNCYATGQEDLLEDYLVAMKKRGITIKIDDNMFSSPNTQEDATAVANAIKAMDSFQCDICSKNDYINEVLATDAETANLSPRNKYSHIIQLAAKKQEGKDVDDRIQDEYVWMELLTNGLEKVTEL